MPIGSRSYYAAVEAASKKKAVAATPPPEPEAPGRAPAAPIDSVVNQIVELANRTAAILTRAEEMARRAEETMIAVEDAMARAEAAAMRAELAATRTELNVATSPIMSAVALPVDTEPELIAEPEEEPNPLPDPVTIMNEQLRVSLLQLDDLENGTGASSVASAVEETGPTDHVGSAAADEPGDTPAPIKPFDVTDQTMTAGPKSPTLSFQSTSNSGPRIAGRSSLVRQSIPPNHIDALARSLVNIVPGADVPRVSPYIIQATPVAEGRSTLGSDHDAADANKTNFAA